MAGVDGGQDATVLEVLGEGTPAKPPPSWLRRIDLWATGAGDAVNPILVKETRQALKSRQFVVTFSLLLLASVGWTVFGSVQRMPAIYDTPSAPHLLIGYFFALAVPMLLIVPLAAYRSLESEIDEGTLDLLSITSLTPQKIVLGKLASAVLQMMLYLVVLFPSVAYAYTLRGIDLPTLVLLMGILIGLALALTITALFLAPIALGKTGQIGSLLAVIALLVGTQFAVAPLAAEMIRYGNPLDPSRTALAVLAASAIGATFCALLLVASAAKLTPESENRSTGIRVAALVHVMTLVAVAALAVGWLLSRGGNLESVVVIPIAASIYLVGFWTVVGAMMCAESPTLTPRIRRSLPGSFLGRLFFTWLTPGPATGLVFSLVTLAVALAAMHLLVQWVAESTRWLNRELEVHRLLCLLALAYLSLGFVGVRGLITLLRSRNVVSVRVGVAALVVVLLVLALVPYSIGLHWHDYRGFDYSAWQATNWVWTFAEAASGRLDEFVLYLVLALGGFAFLAHLLLVGQRVLPQRLATPARVQAEYQRLAGSRDRTPPREIDPLGLGKDDLNP